MYGEEDGWGHRGRESCAGRMGMAGRTRAAGLLHAFKPQQLAQRYVFCLITRQVVSEATGVPVTRLGAAAASAGGLADVEEELGGAVIGQEVGERE